MGLCADPKPAVWQWEVLLHLSLLPCYCPSSFPHPRSTEHLLSLSLLLTLLCSSISSHYLTLKTIPTPKPAVMFCTWSILSYINRVDSCDTSSLAGKTTAKSHQKRLKAVGAACWPFKAVSIHLLSSAAGEHGKPFISAIDL